MGQAAVGMNVPTLESTKRSPVLEGEDGRVLGWREEQLVEAGYPIELAAELARSDVDWHRAAEMLGQGCRPELALEILL